jgi:hypothetical protein
MMRLTWKDAVATVLTGGIVTLYVAFLAGTSLPLVAGPRVLAAVTLVTGMAACAVGGSAVTGRSSGPAVPVAALFGTVAFAAGLVAVVTGSHVMLGVLVGTTVALWILATARHALVRTPGNRIDDGDMRRFVEGEKVHRRL